MNTLGRRAVLGGIFAIAAAPMLGGVSFAGGKRATIILAPHQDDEFIRLSSYIMLCFDRGDDLSLVTATDGAATSVGRRLGLTEAQTTLWRNREQESAWDWLTEGRGAKPVNLGFPDGSVKVGDIVNSIVSLLNGMEGDAEVYVAAYPPWANSAYIPAPGAGDDHVDHAACVEAGERLKKIKIRGKYIEVRYARHPVKTHIGGTFSTQVTSEHQRLRLNAAFNCYKTIAYRSVPDQMKSVLETDGKNVIVNVDKP